MKIVSRIGLCLGLCLGALCSAHAADLRHVPLWDGETVNTLEHRFGGRVLVNNLNVRRVTFRKRSGAASYLVETNGTMPRNGFGFLQLGLAPNGAGGGHTPTRDLSGYAHFELALDNRTGEAFTLSVEIKDYRDSGDHSATYRINVANNTGWRTLRVPLNLNNSGWSRRGVPSNSISGFLDRTKNISLVVAADRGSSVSGRIFIDNVRLIEPGSFVNSNTASARTIASRLAKRQWDALYGSRNRENGLIPAQSGSAAHGGLNVTSAVIKLVPRAIDNGWISRGEGEAYLNLVADSFNRIMDDARFVPGRFFNWRTLASEVIAEESNVDAALLALALHRCKNRGDFSQSLRSKLDRLQNRMNFSAFRQRINNRDAWAIGYNTQTREMSRFGYNSFSGETWVISLAAHLSDNNRTDITELYHSANLRTRTYRGTSNLRHVTSSLDQFRAPFLHWLFSLYVDVSDRGVDTYPNASLAVNPYDNAVRYQRDVHRHFENINRRNFLQPDAGANTYGNAYEQYSAYNDFGNPRLFMPWSASFSMMGDSAVGRRAIRFYLDKGLHGPFGLSDAVRWRTGAANPDRVTPDNDLWNVALSTMALVEFVHRDSRGLSNIPDVRDALNRVFRPR